ncbi:MAG TPA: SIS domain-containing protein [Candidatus Eisenbacteria bacterium]|nr:SIS domain-containing protein [Candidatus Eisenbacteria bacterium]
MRAGDAVRLALTERARLLIQLLEEEGDRVEALARLFADTSARGRTIFFCGNGGSAAEAQHFAAELVGRFQRERQGLPAVALTTDSSILTSVGNDFGFASVFARQVEALGRAGDLLVVLTTSGRSPNVLEAIRAARKKRMRVAAMTGAGGAALARRCDACLVVPSRDTPSIQEMHLVVGHLCCERAEAAAVKKRRGRA